VAAVKLARRHVMTDGRDAQRLDRIPGDRLVRDGHAIAERTEGHDGWYRLTPSGQQSLQDFMAAREEEELPRAVSEQRQRVLDCLLEAANILDDMGVAAPTVRWSHGKLTERWSER
jgi:hypothetical protein